MNALGIYFGPKIISVVESKNKVFLRSVSIPQSKILGQDYHEKVPEEVKISIIFKEELKRAKIEAQDAVVVVSGKDLIIRTFDMPLMPQRELFNAVNFEARKYIPFRVEDLICDFQVQTDKVLKKNFILFAGIKKEILNKYLMIMKQLGLKSNTIDYAGFSVLRLLKLNAAREKGVIAVVDIDLMEEDEINFMVLQNGFPMFSRDIILPTESSYETVKEGKIDVVTNMDKFKSELRISLDFYNRKFPTKKIEKIMFLCSKDFMGELGKFSLEKKIIAQFFDTKKYLPKEVEFSSSLFKAYGGSLTKAVKTDIKINLFASRLKKEAGAGKPLGKGLAGFPLLSELKISIKAVIVGMLICLFAFGYGMYKRLPLERDLNSIRNARPKITSFQEDLTSKQLNSKMDVIKKKMEVLKKIYEARVTVTETLDALPRELPRGMWFNNLIFKADEDNAEITIKGMAYLDDNEKELQLINSFIATLLKNDNVTGYFKDISVVSVDHTKSANIGLTNFVILLKK